MKCRDIRKLNTQSPSDPVTAQLVADHLLSCSACADELGELPAIFVAPPSAIPPPNLTAKIMAQLPASPAIAAASERRVTMRRRTAWGGIAVLLVSLLVFGAYGVLVDSSWPAHVFGGVESTVGRAVLALTLVGKPMIAAFGTLGGPLLLGIVLVSGLSVIGWRRLATPPAAILVEVE
ncbi:MAG: hypothetical protein H0T53_17305 [Herpetosiphonaceae bacterium]|nr:hypothetical protein [Herpetosiphonaceae bacterium]